jgi:hypothetical protein
MGDMNGLIDETVKIPHLSPKGFFHTFVLSMNFDHVYQDLGEATTRLDIKDHPACSFVHGVGPCLAIKFLP